MKTRMRGVLVTGTVCWLLLAALAGAQSSSGILNGQVLDPSGAAMPGVTVTATHPATGESRVAVTSSAGTYQLAGLPVGSYTLLCFFPSRGITLPLPARRSG